MNAASMSLLPRAVKPRQRDSFTSVPGRPHSVWTRPSRQATIRQIMARELEKPLPTSAPTANRLWAEQLAMGMALLIVLLIFMALVHPQQLSVGAEVLGPNDLDAYGWISALGIFLQIVIHELGTIVTAWRWKLPIRFRFFGFGANASAILENQPRRVWTDEVVGVAGPLTGFLVSLGLALTYHITGNPLFLGMACVGYFYNLFTLIPILDLEGGWLAPAITPPAWLLGLVGCVLELTSSFNLVLLCVVCFALPRFILLIRARAPRTDLECTLFQRGMISIGYFVMVISMAWLGSSTFEQLPTLVRDWMGD
jgi:Zn-dependent protease